jgi:hypothetical protein
MLHAPHSTNMSSSEILHFWHDLHSITPFLSLNHGFMHYLTDPSLWIRKKSKSVEQALDSWMEFLGKKSNFQTRVSLIRPKFSPSMLIISSFHRYDMFISLVPQISNSPVNLWSCLSCIDRTFDSMSSMISDITLTWILPHRRKSCGRDPRQFPFPFQACLTINLVRMYLVQLRRDRFISMNVSLVLLSCCVDIITW